MRQQTQTDPEVCNEALRRLTSLLGVSTPDHTVFATQIAPATERPDLEETRQQKIGNFLVERLIEQGGMGAVYLATQTGQGFQRRVALKIVKPELGSPTVLQRFLQERQVLAGLDHPNIARLYDAGSIEGGAPYLAMEFVEGARIDEYCNRQGLSTEARLRLFLTVCDAVQYAHQHLVVHRDIKPSNILVTSAGAPKLLDFGIAKLITPDQEQVEQAMGLTTGGASPMTPMYASPEQARGDTVTTSTDIYSLAILLYELLTGSLPYEFKTMTAAGVERTICETEPTPPGLAKITRKLAVGETEEKVRRHLRGEVDMIVLMALRKEPARRYASVFQFGDDIRRHLEGDPVVAHKDTVGYRVKKFIRRHRAGVIAAALAVTSLAASTVVSLYFGQVARRQQAAAERRFQETRELARYFLTDLDDTIRQGETAARRELVSKGLVYLKRLSEEAAGDVALQKELIAGYLKIGDVQGNPFGPNLGQTVEARASYETALKASEKAGAAGELRTERAQAIRRLADLDAVGGKPDVALSQYRSVENDLAGLDKAELLYRIGWVLTQQGKDKEALASYQEAMRLAGDELNRNAGSKRARDTLAQAAERVGEASGHLGSVSAAIENLRAALVIYESRILEEPANAGLKRRVWSASMLLGDVLGTNNRRIEAADTYRRALTIVESQRRVDPANRQLRIDYVTTLGRLGDLLAADASTRDEAKRLTQSVIETLRPFVSNGSASETEVQQYIWVLLTTPFTELRGAREALPLAEQISQKHGGADPRLLDMVALAEFGSGNRDKAIDVERKAISLLPAAASPMRTELEANLDRFLKSGKR